MAAVRVPSIVQPFRDSALYCTVWYSFLIAYTVLCNICYYLLGRDGIHSCLQYYTQSPCCSSLSQAGGNIYRQCISGNLNNKQLAFYNLKCEQSQPSFCLISLYRSSSFADPDQTESSQNDLVNNLNSKSNPELTDLNENKDI